MLATTLAGTAVCAAVMTFLPLPQSSKGAVSALLLTATFEGPVFPTLFAMTLRGCGKHTFIVSTGLVTAISGGAVWPNIAWAVDKQHQDNPRYSNRIFITLYAAMLAIIVGMSLQPIIRAWITPVSRRVLRQAATPREDGRPPAGLWQQQLRPPLPSAPFVTGLQLIGEGQKPSMLRPVIL